MNDFIDPILRWLEGHEGPLAYLVLFASALLEYVFPPFPGDTVTLFSAFLSVTAGYNPWLTYAVLQLGAMGGMTATYYFGRWMASVPTERRPRFLREGRGRHALDRALEIFARRGQMWLIGNRFLPAFRAVAFVAAGMSNMPLRIVLLWGGLSAAIWNTALFVLGYVAGESWERLQGTAQQLGAILLIAVIGAIVLALSVRWAKKKWDARAETE